MEQNLCEYCYCMHNGNQVCKKYVDAQINKVKQEPQITKWEYEIQPLDNFADMNEIGKEGWELVAIESKIAFFKRLLIK